MIFAIRQPPILLGLVVGFVVGVAVRAQVQRRLATPRARLRLSGAPRLRPHWSSYLDPYGVVAAVLSGVGWGPRPVVRRRGAASDVVVAAAAVLVHAALAAAGLAVFLAVGGTTFELQHLSVASVLHGSDRFGAAGQEIALGFGVENLACGLLALVPVPPLEAGLAAWSRLPRSAGARRFAYHLLEEQWGVAALLVLLLLPLAGELPALLAVINSVGNAILGAV